MINVEGHQERAVKGYNPKKPGNRCYNSQFAFCDEIKAYLTGYVRSEDTYTANGAAEMVKEIMAHLKEEGVAQVTDPSITFLSPTQNNRQKMWLISMKNAGTVRITSRKPSMTWRLGTCCSSHFGPMKRSFSE